LGNRRHYQKIANKIITPHWRKIAQSGHPGEEDDLHVFNSGDSIKCWVCRSDGDPKCADPFDNTSFPITDCRQEKPRDHLPGLLSTMCRKVRQKGDACWRTPVELSVELSVTLSVE
jgi:hypothetical protein